MYPGRFSTSPHTDTLPFGSSVHREVNTVEDGSAVLEAGRQQVTALGLLVSAFLLFPATHALAACPDQHDNTVAEAAANGRGNRVDNPGMHIYNSSGLCARVSSIFVISADNTEFVEVGWYEDPAGGWNYDCIPDTTGAPRRLAFSFDDGLVDCLVPTGDLSIGDAGFSVHDAD